MNKFTITTAIDYASGSPHIGHAYEKIAADVLARWNRNTGKDVFFLTGTDEHGQKIVEKAKEANQEPQEFVDDKAKVFEDLCKTLGLTQDYFIRTTNSDHKTFVQKMLQKSFDNGDIYKGEYVGLYCVGCEQYYSEDELEEGNICPTHKRKCDSVKEENYFFKLSKYEDKLLELYEKNPEFISPKHRRLEVINRVKEGLKDISISRNKEKLGWGVELPFDKTHVTYVWFDALFNYVSGTEINNKQDFWPAEVQIIGKDIMWFHMVYWPAFLMSVEKELPSKVFAHGMILDKDGHKMSKSLGNVIDPFVQIENYGLDEFRYFLLALGSFGEDLSYSEENFATKVNNELNNDFGNLVSRVHAMTQKYFDGEAPDQGELTQDETELLDKLNIFEDFNKEMQNLRFNIALELLWTSIRDTNAYINKVAPWKESNKERLGTILNTLLFAVKVFGNYIDCFMPEKAKALRKQFNFEKEDFSKFTPVSSGHKLGEKENLFKKIEFKKEEPKKMEQNTQEKEGFALLNLKVGKIIEAKQHPEADKLYVETIDLGEESPRQIVSGLKGYYELEELVGKKVVVVANLKPAKLRGVKSEGMVLVAETEDESQVGFLETQAEVGTSLVCRGVEANNESRIKIDKFFEFELKSDGDKASFEGNEITAGETKLTIDRNISGSIR